MKHKVLISDKLAPEGVAILSEAEQLEVDLRPGMEPEELRGIVGGYEALIIRSGTKVTSEIVDSATSLRVVGRAGIGVDNVDVDAASKRGIVVMNTPGGNTVTTAEHTVSMLLSLARHIPQAHASLRAGEWRRSDFVGSEVCGKILGIVGIGNIGSIVADRARGLKMKVVAYDPFITEEAAVRMGIELVTLEDLYQRADFISVHTPLTDDTRGLIGTAAFAQMKKSARIVNCARGGIVDEAALLVALDDGMIAGAALDVFVDEPPDANNPLLSHPLVVVTPHLGANTGEAQLNVAVAVAEQVRDFLVTGIIRNAVNVPSVSEEEGAKLRPYSRLAEKIGCLHAQLTEGVPNEVRIEYKGDIADMDCRPVHASVLKGLLGCALDTQVNVVNAPFLAADRGIRVVELRNPQPIGFTNAIKVEFVGSDHSNIIEGAVFGEEVIRLVRFDDFHFEAVPEGIILVLHNRDVPGVVGNVGTFLAKENINIAGLELGRIGGEAVSFVHVDSALDEAQLRELRKLPDITGARMARLV